MIRIPFKKIFLRTIGKLISSDVFAYRMPVSVKGVCFIEDKVVLLKNERGEWDLPGGKLGRKEDVKSALKREMWEELRIEIEVEKILEVFTIRIKDQIDVLMVVYYCSTKAAPTDLTISEESFELKLFSYEELGRLTLANQNLYHTVSIAHRTLNKK